MDARIEGQSSGVVVTIPSRANRPAAPEPGASSPASSSSSVAGAKTAELSDANGDGTIESWSFSYGGDSFATFAPPPRVPIVHPRHNAHAQTDGKPPPARTTGDKDAHVTTPAAIHHAQAAYERDGATPAVLPAAASTDPVITAAAPSTTAPAAPAPPVTQSDDATALPSSPS